MSKRSENDYSGRNDNNTLVVFPNKQLPFVENGPNTSFRNPEIGDYVACRLLSATSQSFKAEPLFICKLQTFAKIDDVESYVREMSEFNENNTERILG